MRACLAVVACAVTSFRRFIISKPIQDGIVLPLTSAHLSSWAFSAIVGDGRSDVLRESMALLATGSCWRRGRLVQGRRAVSLWFIFGEMPRSRSATPQERHVNSSALQPSGTSCAVAQREPVASSRSVGMATDGFRDEPRSSNAIPGYSETN